MNLKDQRAAALKAARETAEAAKSAGRNLTAEEVKSIDGHLAKADELKAEIDRAEESRERFRKMAEITDETGDETGNGTAFLGRKDALAGNMHTAMGKASGGKALITAGDVIADVPQVYADPITDPRPPVSLIEAIPVRTVRTPTFGYLRQTTRDNQAAPVASGGTKPTSAYGLTPVEGKLHVIAHISEPFDEYWVEDNGSLLTFLRSEMTYGLYTALEGQVLNGDGVGANLTGIANTSGIQTQAYDTSTFVTTRKAVTKVDVLGYSPRAFLMNPADWEDFETSAFSSGNYILNAEGRGNLPVDAAARRLWGIPVILSTTQTAGSAFLLSDGTVELLTDGSVKAVTTHAVGTDFETNQLRMRVESRFEVAVTAPAGIVSIDLTAV